MTDEFQLGETAAIFIQKHAQLFASVTNSDDIPLAAYEAYEEYQALFEDKLQLFCSQHGVDKFTFAEWCRTALIGASEDNGGSREFLEILLASESFPVFFKLMTDAVKFQLLQQQQQQHQQQRKK